MKIFKKEFEIDVTPIDIDGQNKYKIIVEINDEKKLCKIQLQYITLGNISIEKKYDISKEELDFFYLPVGGAIIKINK